jgi:fibronectin-binding autotransporter adhesin
MSSLTLRDRIGLHVGAVALASSLLMAAICSPAHAAVLSWNPGGSGGGPGTWDTASNSWYGSANVAWSNSDNANDTGVFGGASGGLVTLGTSIIAGGLTFNTGGYTIADNGSGTTLTLNGSNPTITANADAAISAAIPTAAALTKEGSGTLTLSGTLNYTGVTTVNQGTLVWSNPGAGPHSSALSVASGATLQVDTPSQNSGYGVCSITGSGTYLKTGTGTWDMLLGSNNPATQDYVSMSTGGLIDVQQGELRLGWGPKQHWDNNSASLNVAGGAKFNAWDCAAVYVDALTGSGTFYASYVAPSLTLGVAGGSGTFSGTLQSISSLVKTGSGTQTLSGVLNYTGPTNVNQGTLAISISTILASTAVTVASGATLQMPYDGTGTPGFGATSISGAGTIQKTGTGNWILGFDYGAPNSISMGSGGLIDVSAGTLTTYWSTAINWTNNLAGLHIASGATFNMNDANNVMYVDALTGTGRLLESNGAVLHVGVNDGSGTFNGTISGGAGSIVKHGTGTQTLAGIMTFTGTTTVSQGVLCIANTFNSPVLSIASGATVQIDSTLNPGGGATNALRSISGGGTYQKIGAGIADMDWVATTSATGFISMSPGALIDVQSGTLRLGWGVSQNWSGNKASLNLAAGTTFDLWDCTSGVWIDALTGSGTITDGVGYTPALPVGGANGSGTFSGAIQNIGNLTKTGSGTQTLTGTTACSGATTVNQGVLALSSVPVFGGTSVYIAGGATFLVNTINGTTGGGGNTDTNLVAVSGSGTYQKTGSGEWDFLANNGTTKYVTMSTGALIDVQGGKFQLSSGAAQNWSGNQASLNVASGATFDLWDCPAVYVDSLTGSGTVRANWGAPALTVGVAGGSGAFSGTIQNAISLTKTGGGVQTLSGASTYSGPTTVNGGVLEATRTAALPNFSSGTSSVTSGAVLAVQAQSANAPNGWTSGNIDSLTGNSNAVFAAGSSLGVDVVGSDAFTRSTAFSLPSDVGLMKLGSGALILTAPNTYTGPTTIAGGTLQLGDGTGGNDGSLATSGIANYGSLVYGLAGSQTASYSISGSGGLTKSGSGTLALTGSNSYSGGTTLNGGILNFTATSNLGTGPITFGGGTLQWATGNTSDISTYSVTLGAGGGGLDTNGNAVTLSGAIGNGGTGGLSKIGSGTLTLAGTNTYSGATNIDGGNLQVGAGGATGSIVGDISLASGAALCFSRSDTCTYAGQISGSGTVTQAGSGMLILTNADNSQATTILSAGVLSVSSDGNLGASASVAFSGGILQVTGTALAGLSSHSVNWTTFNGGFDIVDAESTFTISGTIAGGGSLTKKGSGTLVLAGFSSQSSSFAGGTTVQAGTLQVGDGASANGGLGGADSVSGHVTVSAGATLRFANPYDQTYSGVISGSGKLVKAAAGTLVLDGSNTFTGGATLNAGTLSIASEPNIGGPSSAITFNGGAMQFTGTAIANLDTHSINWETFNGTLDIADAGNTFTVTQAFGGTSLGKAGDGVLRLAGSNTCAAINVSAGTLDLSGLTASLRSLNSTPGGTIAIGTASVMIGEGDTNSTLAGTITGSGGGLLITGTGTTVFGGSNSFSGVTSLSNLGTLTLADSQALRMSTLDYGTGGGLLSFGSLTAATLGGLAGTNYHDTGFDNRLALVNVSGTAVTLSVGNNGQNTDFTGDILGTGSLIKIGSGTLTLSGTDTYTGSTTVLGGVLDIASVSALPGNSTLVIANTAEVVFATDLGSAIQLSLMLPGGGEPGMTCFRVTTGSPASVPEPGTLLLLAAAAIAGAIAHRKLR